MPTIFTHAVAGAALTQLLPRKYFDGKDRAVAMTAAAFAMLPDADVISFSFGVAYGNMFGHRGITHSLAFAAAVGFAAWWSYRSNSAGRVASSLCIGLATASHGVLDAFTNGGRGVAFFAPFSAERYFFPMAPIAVSPIGFGFFSERGMRVLMSELVWVWIPAGVLVLLTRLIRREAIRTRAPG